MNKRINRPEYLNRLIEYRDADVVKIVTGIRRWITTGITTGMDNHGLPG